MCKCISYLCARCLDVARRDARARSDRTKVMSDAFRRTAEEPRRLPSEHQHSKYVEMAIGNANADAFRDMVVQAVEDAGTQAVGYSR